jgi:ABC-type oligopeptide transport system substrate-binding subunit
MRRPLTVVFVSFVTLLAVSLLTFFMMKLVPGGPFDTDVSAGTYVLKEWHRDSKIILGLNPHYYAPMPETIPEVEFRVVKDDSVAVSLFDTGDLDIVRNLPPTQLRSLAQRPEFHASEYLRLTYFGFNLKDPSVANPKIRKALALAIDKTEIEKLLFPLAKASNA